VNSRQLWLEDGADTAVVMAAKALCDGGTVVFPTDTVYGLLAASWSREAYQRLFSIKGRPSGKPLALLVARPCALVALAEQALSAHAELLNAFRQGTLTAVLPLAALPALPAPVKQIQPGPVGLRCPRHTALQQLLATVGGLAWATSLNAADEPPLADAIAAQTWLSRHGDAVALAVLAREPLPGHPSRVVRLQDGVLSELR
jgi:L-threonylcarbamoyladenylate synthase